MIQLVTAWVFSFRFFDLVHGKTMFPTRLRPPFVFETFEGSSSASVAFNNEGYFKCDFKGCAPK